MSGDGFAATGPSYGGSGGYVPRRHALRTTRAYHSTERGHVQFVRALIHEHKRATGHSPGSSAAEQVFHHRFTHLPLYDVDNAQFKYTADALIDAGEEMRAVRGGGGGKGGRALGLHVGE